VAKYLRFVVGGLGEDARLLTGVITEARQLRDSGLLQRHELDTVNDVFEWFNANIPCPPWSDKKWTADAVSWFKEDAGVSINKLWLLVDIIKHQDKVVRVIRASDPGMIVYSDKYQVVAESPKHRKKLA